MGLNVLGRWRHEADDGAETIVQSYYDTESRTQFARQKRHTFDLEAQHSFDSWGSHNVMVGAGYRYHELRVSNNPLVGSQRPIRGDNLWSVFVHGIPICD